MNNTFHAFELYEANHGFEEITEKISVTDASFPLKSNFKTGVAFRNEEKDIEVDYISDGIYCAAGTKNKLSMVKGKCDILDKTEAIVDVKVNKVTTSSITVVVVANDPESGIEGIYYKIGDSEYKKGTERNTFDNLKENKEYTISVRVVNGNKVETTVEVKATTLAMEEATYEVSSSDWEKEKTVTITYPEGENLTYEYSIDKGKTWLPAEKEQEVKFTENGILIARILYGTNEKVFSTLSVDKIDTTKPTIDKVDGNTDDWSRSKTLIVTASDTESGVKEYSFDNGANWQSSNSKTVTENKTYQIKVRDNAGNISDATEVTVSKIDNEEPSASVSVTGVTTKSISVSATCEAASGISKYEYSKDNGANYIDGTTSTYTFENLTTGTYNIKVRCTSNTGKTNEGSTIGTTGELDNITFGVPSGWATSKNVTINYPDNYTYRYKVASGTAKKENTELTVDNWYETTNKSEIVTFTSNGVLVAEINDGENKKVVSQNITEIDTQAPSVPTSELRKNNETGELISLPNSDSVWYNYNLWWGNFNATDSESGVNHYEYSEECVGTKSGTLGTSYIYPTSLYPTVRNSTYCIRAVDNVGNASDWTDPTYIKIDKEVPIISKIEGNAEEWSRSKTLKVTAIDTGRSGLETNAYSFDNGATWQSSNSKTINANGTYQIKVRDNAGNVSDATEVIISKIDATNPIVTLGDSQVIAHTNNTVTFTSISTTGITNVSCNNGAIPSVSGTTLTVTNVTKDTKCSLNTTLDSAVSASDTSATYILMLSDEKSSGNFIGDNKNITLNLNSKKISGGVNLFYVAETGKLLIEGNGLIYSYSETYTSNGAIKMYGSGKAKLTINGNTCNSTNLDEYKTGLLIYAKANSSLSNYGVKTEGSGDAEINITGGCYYSEERFGIEINGQTSGTIKNANIYGKMGGIANDSTNNVDLINNIVNSENNSLNNSGTGIVNIYSGTFTSDTGVVINNTSGTVNIKDGTFDAKAKTTIYNSSTNDINISGGKFLSNDNVIYNTSTGNINITDTDAKVYIASNFVADGAPWNHSTVANASTGNINIKGHIADKCGEEENTTGICVYNNYARCIQTANNSAATGIINIDGAYLVSPYGAVMNHYGTINICSGRLEGGSYSLGNLTSDTSGYTYYKNNVILSGAISEKHIISDNSLTCN